MKKITLIILFLSLCLVSFGQTKKASVKAVSAKGKTVTVYATAENTSHRLAQTAQVKFAEKRQPTEGEISVFVNPAKSFQTFLGVGGAFTDASAETFAKLSPAKQQEFLEAYFSKEKGIAYTLGRTTIHSSDFSSGSYTYIAFGKDQILGRIHLVNQFDILEHRLPAAPGLIPVKTDAPNIFGGFRIIQDSAYPM